MKKLKIMIVTPYFYPKIGGMENYAFNIAKGLKEKYNWDVVIITSNHVEKKYAEEIINGLKIYRLPILFKISNTPINPFWWIKIKKIIKKEKPDLINAHSPVPYISDITALVRGKIPFTITYHSGDILKTKSIYNIIIWPYQKIILPHIFNISKGIICGSPEYIKTHLNRWKQKTFFITPGVDLMTFKPLKIYRTKRKRIIFIGRMEKNTRTKGILHLIEALYIIKQRYSDVTLVLVGPGNDMKFYKNASIKNNVKNNLIFIGPKRGISLTKEINKSDVLVLPSTNCTESFGMVLIEAMACKKPVIGSNIGGIPYVIDNDKNGLLVKPQNSADLANAIIKILDNPGLARKMGNLGYRKVLKQYTWDIQVFKTHKLFKKIIEENEKNN